MKTDQLNRADEARVAALAIAHQVRYDRQWRELDIHLMSHMRSDKRLREKIIRTMTKRRDVIVNRVIESYAEAGPEVLAALKQLPPLVTNTGIEIPW